ncbi:hypothetical protein SDRG_08997 [Saprolegnia diclina VS20]|uniref:Uncharacterized protein n=1 Tax=Saprolegnia diclina (strain VS20) TaxID=1156394 RepID=T0RMG1_SAPDV|nr:hypothetical protein SDRG_08997 [Saprolegnia diclina VS20]EQC33488.1 hypothetical protein SDRG_08997 [Saprolegnia diclina VS20]|eukprot:XP_008613128.1 hypothetical protein SDRG_08997 [Saprolegnia diclina VS20]
MDLLPEEPHRREANLLSIEDIRSEMMRYGIPAHESVPSTLVILQRKFDDEFNTQMTAYAKIMERYRRKKNKNEMAARAERIVAEDSAALAANPKMRILVDQVLAHETNASLTVRGIDDATCRAFLHAMEANKSVLTLDLSNNELGESVAEAVAGLLRHNRSLQTLDLGANHFNASSLLVIGPALAANKVLSSISFESNPLTSHNNAVDLSGFEVLCSNVFSNTTTLRSVNFFRCGLNVEAGRMLSKALLFNESVIALDIGCNAMADKELEVIAIQLEENRLVHDKMQAKVYALKKQVAADADAKYDAKCALEKAETIAKWHDDNAAARHAQYERDAIEAARHKCEEHARIQKQIAEKEAARKLKEDEARLKAEAKAKKKKK